MKNIKTVEVIQLWGLQSCYYQTECRKAELTTAIQIMFTNSTTDYTAHTKPQHCTRR